MHVCVKPSSRLYVNINSHARRICLYLYSFMSHMWRFCRSLSKARGQNICQFYNKHISFLFLHAFVWFWDTIHLKYSWWYFYRMIQNTSKVAHPPDVPNICDCFSLIFWSNIVGKKRFLEYLTVFICIFSPF